MTTVGLLAELPVLLVVLALFDVVVEAVWLPQPVIRSKLLKPKMDKRALSDFDTKVRSLRSCS